MIFVMLGSLDNPEGIKSVLETFTKRRLKWAKPLDLPQILQHAELSPSDIPTQLTLKEQP